MGTCTTAVEYKCLTCQYTCQHQCSTNAVPMQYQCSTDAVYMLDLHSACSVCKQAAQNVPARPDVPWC